MKTSTFVLVALVLTLHGFTVGLHLHVKSDEASDTPRSKRVGPGIAQVQDLPALAPSLG